MVTKRTLLYKEHSFGERRYPRDTRQCGCQNPVCIHHVTDRERTTLLLEYVDVLRENGWPDIRLVPLWENSRGPRIRKGDSIEDVETVTPEEAARRIREEGVRGFYIYADMPAHGTEGLIFTDEDEPDQWPDIRDTLQVISGSGEGRHRSWTNDG